MNKDTVIKDMTIVRLATFLGCESSKIEKDIESIEKGHAIIEKIPAWPSSVTLDPNSDLYFRQVSLLNLKFDCKSLGGPNSFENKISVSGDGQTVAFQADAVPDHTSPTHTFSIVNTVFRYNTHTDEMSGLYRPRFRVQGTRISSDGKHVGINYLLEEGRGSAILEVATGKVTPLTKGIGNEHNMKDYITPAVCDGGERAIFGYRDRNRWMDGPSLYVYDKRYGNIVRLEAKLNTIGTTAISSDCTMAAFTFKFPGETDVNHKYRLRILELGDVGDPIVPSIKGQWGSNVSAVAPEIAFGNSGTNNFQYQDFVNRDLIAIRKLEEVNMGYEWKFDSYNLVSLAPFTFRRTVELGSSPPEYDGTREARSSIAREENGYRTHELVNFPNKWCSSPSTK